MGRAAGGGGSGSGTALAYIVALGLGHCILGPDSIGLFPAALLPAPPGALPAR